MKKLEFNIVHQKLNHLIDYISIAENNEAVINNIGNYVNSINISSEIIEKLANNHKVNILKIANQKLKEHQDNLTDYLNNDPVGIETMEIYSDIVQEIQSDLGIIKKENLHIEKFIDETKKILNVQKNKYQFSINEKGDLKEILEDVILVLGGHYKESNVRMISDINLPEEVLVPRNKVLVSLYTILRICKETALQNPPANRSIKIGVKDFEDFISINILCTGTSEKIFQLSKINDEKKISYSANENPPILDMIKKIGGDLKVTEDNSSKSTIIEFTLPKGQYQELKMSA
jgi:hypothetical protein